MASNSQGIFTNTMGFLVTFNNFPEWAIPFTKLIPKITLPKGTDINADGVMVGCRHWWFSDDKNDSTSSMNMYVEINCYVTTTDNQGDILIEPSSVDLDLVVLNEQIYEELNPFKS